MNGERERFAAGVADLPAEIELTQRVRRCQHAMLMQPAQDGLVMNSAAGLQTTAHNARPEEGGRGGLLLPWAERSRDIAEQDPASLTKRILQLARLCRFLPCYKIIKPEQWNTRQRNVRSGSCAVVTDSINVVNGSRIRQCQELQGTGRLVGRPSWLVTGAGAVLAGERWRRHRVVVWVQGGCRRLRLDGF